MDYAKPNTIKNNYTDINPNLYYVQNWLGGCRTKEGERLDTYLSKLRRSAKIAWLPHKPIGFAYLGKDILAAIEDSTVNNDKQKERIQQYINNTPPEEIFKLVTKNYKLQRQIQSLKQDRQNYNYVVAENDMLKCRLNKRIITDEQKLNAVKTTIINWLGHYGAPKIINEHFFDALIGVYVLFQNDTPVYIGQSVNILQRVSTHKAEKAGLFNNVKFFACKKDELNEKEMFLIKLFKPELNGQYKHKPHPNIFGLNI